MKKIFFVLLFALSIMPILAQNNSAAYVISEQANLRGTPSTQGAVVARLAANQSLEIVKKRGPWYLVQSSDYVGWLHGNTIRLGTPDREIYEYPDDFGRPAPASVPVDSPPQPTFRPRTAEEPVQTNAAPAETPSETSGTASRTYITGERGGCYYINSNGNRTYVDRELCGSQPETSEPASVPSSGGSVTVRGYYRKDGTYVRPHTRSAPRRRN